MIDIFFCARASSSCGKAFTLPRPGPLSQSEKELVERSRFLSESLKYSGYYVVPDASSGKLLQRSNLVTSALAATSGGQQIYSATHERYSDRYRKILGKKNFFHEIKKPNLALFPMELLNQNYKFNQKQATFTSKAQFLSSKTLANEVAVSAHSERECAAQRRTYHQSYAGDERA